MAHLNRFVTQLHTSMPDLSAEDMADMLWLSLHMGSQPVPTDDTPETDMPDVSSILGDGHALPLPDDEQPADIPDEIDETDAPPWTEMTDEQVLPQVTVEQSQPKMASLYADNRQRHEAPTMETHAEPEMLPFSTPGAAALPGKLELARSLRPLKHRVDSHTNVAVDEDATVQRIADEGLWVPALRPAKVRWLDVALVVDSAASVHIWQQAILELQRLLAHHGAFRDVRIWELVTDDHDGTLHFYAGYGSNSSANASNKGASPRQRERNPRELIDPSGRRLVLLISDCVSAAWRNGSIATNLLALWGRYNLVTVVHVLPDSLWSRTALGMEMDVLCYAPSPCRPNQYLRYDEPQVFFGERVQHGLCLPVVTLEPDALAAWVHLVLGNEDVRIPGFVLPIMPAAPPSTLTRGSSEPPRRQERQEVIGDSEPPRRQERQDDSSTGMDQTAHERVTRFYVTASATAFKLAGLLSAAAPLNLHIMRLVQQAMLPESRQVHLAEVFLSGLLRPIHPHTPHESTQAQAPDYVPYDFYAGVREELQASVLVPDSMQVLAIVSDYIGRHMGHPVGFSALLAEDPEALARLADEDYRPFAHVAASLLRRMGGRYAELAGRMEPTPQPQPDDLLREMHAQDVPSVADTPQPPLGGALFPFTIAEWHKELQNLSTTFGQPRGYWCYVQPGTYRIGGWEKGQESANITLPAFWIAKHPITVAQYRQFIDAGGYHEKRWWTPNGWKWKNKWNRTKPWRWDNILFNDANQPLGRITWYEAIAFANWLIEKFVAMLPEEYSLRLPTEAEWEIAAAYDVHGQRRTYPWGEKELTPERAVYSETGAKAPATVGGRPDGAAACGAHDMVGNVWEWTMSENKGYPSTSNIIISTFGNFGWDVVSRGGSYTGSCKDGYMCRNYDSPSLSIYYKGFRLVIAQNSHKT